MFVSKKFKLIVLLLTICFYFFILRNSFLDNDLTRSELGKSEEKSTQEFVLESKTNESKEEFIERIKQRMNERKQLIQETCKKFGKRLGLCAAVGYGVDLRISH